MNSQHPESAALEFLVHSLNDEWDQIGVDLNIKSPITRWHALGALGGAALVLSACGGKLTSGSETTDVEIVKYLSMADKLWATLGVSLFFGVANGVTAWNGWKQQGAVAKAQAEMLSNAVNQHTSSLQSAYEARSATGGGILAMFGGGEQEGVQSLPFGQFSEKANKLSQIKGQLAYWEQKAKETQGIGIELWGKRVGLPSGTVAWDTLKETVEGAGATFYGFQVALPAATVFLSSLGETADPATRIILGAKAVVIGAIGILATYAAWKKQTGNKGI